MDSISLLIDQEGSYSPWGFINLIRLVLLHASASTAYIDAHFDIEIGRLTF